MKRIFESSKPVITPLELVTAITKKKKDDLFLPKRALIVFNHKDITRLLSRLEHSIVEAWSSFRTVYSLKGKDTVITRSAPGGPNIAAIVEEFADFGVKEFVVWGYCGGIKEGIELGSNILVSGALREDGVSYHYLREDANEIIYSNWAKKWQNCIDGFNFIEGIVWSCDAIYRETEKKVQEYAKRGIVGVEMEVASFYSVCNYRNVKGIAFLVVSDLLTPCKWIAGFHEDAFKRGAMRLMEFILDKVII